MIRTAILSVGEARGPGEAHGALAVLREKLAKGPFTEVDFQSVPDEQAMVRARLRLWADGEGVDLVLTLGGIGLALRDRTPEATMEVLERSIPGIPELMRWASFAEDGRTALSRGVAGVRRGTLLVNLPSEMRHLRSALDVALPVVAEAVELIRGEHGTVVPS